MMTSHFNYASSFATKSDKRLIMSDRYGKSTNKTKQNTMKEIKVIGLSKPISVPEHVIIDETKQAVLIDCKVKSVSSAESATTFDGSKRLSIVAEKEFIGSDGKSHKSFTKNAMKIADKIVGYDDLNYEMSTCVDINDKLIFEFNKIKREQAALFNAVLNGALIKIVSVPIKAGSPTWDDNTDEYKEDVLHYEILNIVIPNESKSVQRLQTAYQRYIAAEERKQAQAAAAEAAEPLPEL